MNIQRHVLITGAAGGLGEVTAAQFLAKGDRVYASDISEAGCARLAKTTAVTDVSVLDVSDRTSVVRYFDRLWALTDRIDVLVNNVGIAGLRGCIEEIDPEAWSHTIAANLNGAYWMIRSVLGRMKQQRFGVILNVSTASVKLLPVDRAPYLVSKAALETLSLAVAREAGSYDVRCNVVRPGMMDNERLSAVLQRIAQEKNRSVLSLEQEALGYVSMRSKIAMEEVASMLVFLSSDAARHVTGQVIAVDGDAQWEA